MSQPQTVGSGEGTKRRQWVWANAVAWCAGLLVFTAVTTPCGNQANHQNSSLSSEPWAAC